MAVRESLMGILTLGPAYGLQLHYELGARAPHRTKTNVGQIYATLERLNKAGLVASAGTNTEGLPLWQLTEAGQADAQSWLSGESLTELPEWSDLLDLVLISRSVNTDAATALLPHLTALVAIAPETTGNALADAATAHFRGAVRDWLALASESVATGVVHYQLARPKRGRPARGNLSLSSPKGQTA
jgi:DNA-binding PadR family transcriptional regulator